MLRGLSCALAVGVITVAISGCEGTRIENVPLQAGQGNPERRSLQPLSAGRPAILMTFSGGGSRATALAAAVLQEMASTSYAAVDGDHPLTMDIKAVSSVSGGSV